ncbi:MAG: hypothetical protein ABR600_00595 [Actinomycetota bacterium]
MKRRRRFARLFERVVLGGAMSMIAFVIERRVLKAIRAKGDAPAPAAEHHGEVTRAPHRS